MAPAIACSQCPNVLRSNASLKMPKSPKRCSRISWINMGQRIAQQSLDVVIVAISELARTWSNESKLKSNTANQIAVEVVTDLKLHHAKCISNTRVQGWSMTSLSKSYRLSSDSSSRGCWQGCISSQLKRLMSFIEKMLLKMTYSLVQYEYYALMAFLVRTTI